jgi:hypothetical protein
MKTRTEPLLRLEASRFSLRFACEDCAHFDAGGDGRPARCGHGYPPGPRRDALAEAELAFCKEFELT